MTSPVAFICVVTVRSPLGNFERPPRDLDDAVVQGWLERRDSPLRDRVRYLVEALASGDLRGHARNGVSGGLACQGGAAANPRVDLDDVVRRVHTASPRKGRRNDVSRFQGELNVAPAFDAQGPDDPQSCRAQHLVFLVRECLAWRDDDAVAGVRAHRVDVLHVADGDAVARAVPHDLVLDFLPTDERFLQQHLMNRTGRQAGCDDAVELVLGVGDAAACAAERVCRTHDERQTKRILDRDGLIHIGGGVTGRDRFADLQEQLTEQVTVLGLAN